MKPTNKRFFALWSIDQLQEECARLNRVIVEVSESADKFLKKTGEKNETE